VCVHVYASVVGYESLCVYVFERGRAGTTA